MSDKEAMRERILYQLDVARIHIDDSDPDYDGVRTAFSYNEALEDAKSIVNEVFDL
jgi:hypothetical protein